MKSLLPSSEFAHRRNALVAKMGPGSIAIIRSATMMPRNSDVDYPFRQNSDFYYLTGFDEPNAVLVLINNDAERPSRAVLFCQAKDPEMEIWHGYRCGPEAAVSAYGVDEAFPIDDLDERMPELMNAQERVYYSLGNDAELDAQVVDWLNTLRQKSRQGMTAPTAMVLLDKLLHEMRLFKSAEEAELMRQAGEISAQAHIRAMQVCKPGMTEFQLEAEIIHHFAMNGSRQAAYPSIVGGGDNACVLHYTENSQPLMDGDLVLIDAGCEHDYYAGDITRTFPVNGTFTAPQKAVYELVLAAQEACLELVKPGTPWLAVHDRSVEVLTQGLIDLGLLQGDLESLIETGAYREFYMHRIGHWLGMDVHDVGDYKLGDDWRALEPGMVMTVEPGIYISPQNDKVDEKWRGIGVRIEDDVLVTESGCEILTASVPKKVSDIEALMATTK
ncbi:MAG: Xaa-Pro aminopeptidase [Pontibacterium sp.]